MLKSYVEVKDKKGNTVTSMDSKQFIDVVSKQFGSSRTAFLADAIKVYNAKNDEGNTASQVMEKNGKRIGENMKAKSILESWKRLKGISESACAVCESEECECEKEDSDDKQKIVDSDETEEKEHSEEDSVEIGEPEVLESEEDEEEISESSYSLVLMQWANGVWSFVGHVPVKLGWVNKDGSPVDDATAEKLSRASNPAWIAKARVFATKEEALEACKELGVKPAQIIAYKGYN